MVKMMPLEQQCAKRLIEKKNTSWNNMSYATIKMICNKINNKICLSPSFMTYYDFLSVINIVKHFG